MPPPHITETARRRNPQQLTHGGVGFITRRLFSVQRLARSGYYPLAFAGTGIRLGKIPRLRLLLWSPNYRPRRRFNCWSAESAARRAMMSSMLLFTEAGTDAMAGVAIVAVGVSGKAPRSAK